MLSNDEELLSNYEISDGSELIFKDYGPQIGYQTVFIVEYLGPLAFVLLYATRPSFIYGPGAAEKPFNLTAWMGVLAWSAHFLKRELETLYVHHFSRPTMPLFNLFKNSIYYWTFGLVVGYPLCHPNYTAPESETQIRIGLALFVIAELLNFATHMSFRRMRRKGSKDRPMPIGALFSFVSCPNYTFEVLSWVGFSLMTQIAAAYLFTLIGFLQMTDWALKKHSSYLRTYGEQYKCLKRKAIIPFII